MFERVEGGVPCTLSEEAQDLLQHMFWRGNFIAVCDMREAALEHGAAKTLEVIIASGLTRTEPLKVKVARELEEKREDAIRYINGLLGAM
jgi:hypothetical protein